MIETTFEHMHDAVDPVTVLMPEPVRVGEYVEFYDTSWLVHTVTWLINTNPGDYTRTVSLHVRIK